MRARYLTFIDRIHSSYWFIPSVMTALAVGLAYLTTWLDRAMGKEVVLEIGYVYSGGPEGARELFAMVAGSMITVAGVTFSITIVALTLASQQFGPRVLYSFMRDRGNQTVLGTFVAVFMYCLMLLRTVRSESGQEFVPQISASVTVLLAMAGLGVLIYFIHHVSTSIQVATIISSVGKNLDDSIDHLFPCPINRAAAAVDLPPAAANPLPEGFAEEAVRIDSRTTGYVQMVEEKRLLAAAREHDLVVRLENRPGKFVFEGTVIVWAWPADRLNDRLIFELRECVAIGSHRTAMQDVEFSIGQLVDLAVRVLSPAINDPSTANMCVDRLAASLSRLAGRDVPSCYRLDSSGKLRVVVAEVPTFTGIVNAAFNEIRQYGSRSAPVQIHLLEAIAIIGGYLTTEEQRDALMRQAIMIERAGQNLPEELDRADLEERFQKALRALRNQSTEVTGLTT